MSQFPLVSIVAVSYNQESYIRESLSSLLAQNYSPLQIVISDDHSSDSTFEIISEIAKTYEGPHELIIHKNPINLGIGGNRNQAIQLTSGELLATADGDDISAPNRISELVKFWNQTSHPLLITTDAIDTTESGKVLEEKHCSNLQDIDSPDSFLSNKPLFWGCTNFYSRKLINEFGGLNKGVGADDQIIVFRALLLGRACSLHQPLVYHRQGGVGSTKAISAKEKGLLLIKKAPIALADIEQMLQDAKKVGKEQAIRKILNKSMDEASFTLALSKKTTILKKIKLFKQYPAAPFFKKLRIFSYICTPFIFQIFFRL